MDFKKFISDAGASLNRAVQKTQESFGGAEKTEYDAHIENLMLITDNTKKWTEKIIEHLEAKLQPNPAIRMEEFLYDKLEKRVEKTKPSDLLGETLKNAAEELGSNSVYGNALLNCGKTEQRLAAAEKQFIHQVTVVYLAPLRKFLKEDIVVIMRERSVLEDYRLDLDATKGKLRKVKAEAAKKATEEELHIAQNKFNKQLEQTKQQMESISAAHAQHVQHLKEYVNCQLAYFEQCHKHMEELKAELN